MTDNQLLVDTSDVVHIDNEETIIGTKTFSRDTVVKNLSPMMTNCITEIPQDIKLELNNGTLTLKAGSKVYVPNGSGVFDMVTTAQDYTVSVGAPTGKRTLFFLTNGAFFVANQNINLYSGTTAPTPSTASAYWYDTTNNLIKNTNNTGSTWNTVTGATLPIAIVTFSSGTGITSIDQVFNGFGYIGSTVFALPGVKCLTPYGRNEDGSLRNTKHTTSSVLTTTNNDTGKQTICLYSSAIETYYGGDKKDFGVVYYDDVENKNYASFAETALSFVGYVVRSSGKVTSFTPKTVFHALDWNDKSTIAGFSMPSNKYIDLTLLASGSYYTAPANGYVNIIKASTAAGQYISGKSGQLHGLSRAEGAQNVYLWLPVKSGEKFGIWYTVDGDTSFFKFIYAEGEQ